MDITAYHQNIDKFSSAWMAEFQAAGKKIFCRKGCSGCCNLAVHATFPEAAAAAASLSDGQQTSLNRYINRLKDVVPGLKSLKDYLKTHRQQLGPCPFLDEQGSCSIYDQRPLSCRSLLSTRPSDWCTVDFSTLNEWDKRAYESSLDKEVVAWPTHFIAATQDFARKLETEILLEMQTKQEWSLSGNFPLMVWLATQYQEAGSPHGANALRDILTDSGLNSNLLVTFVGHAPLER